MTCIGEPISWLRLERHALGELDGAAAATVRGHLDACEACRAALASIEGDRVALPPLARPAPIISLASRRRRWALAGGVAAAVAAAAALLLWLRVPGGDQLPGRRVRVKGAGVVALTLVRERAGVIAFDPAEVAPDDRWKLQLTCDRAAPLWADVVVYQRGEASFPLPPQPLTCGNAVAVPGAFRVTGGGATLCVALADRAPDRVRLARGPHAAGALACATVTAPTTGP